MDPKEYFEENLIGTVPKRLKGLCQLIVNRVFGDPHLLRDLGIGEPVAFVQQQDLPSLRRQAVYRSPKTRPNEGTVDSLFVRNVFLQMLQINGCILPALAERINAAIVDNAV